MSADWLDRFVALYADQNPVDATFIGWHERDGHLPDASVAAVESASRDVSRLRSELGEVDPATLDPSASMDRDLIEGYLEIRAWELESEYLLGNPSWYIGEAIFGAFSLLFGEPSPSEERITALRQRLAAFPRLLGSAAPRLSRAPRSWIARASRECEGALRFLEADVEHLSFAGRLGAEVDTAAGAVRDYARALDELPGVDDDAGTWAGTKAFDRILARAHGYREGPTALAALAESELRSSLAALESGASDWRAELSGLAAVHPDREGYYDRFRALWEESHALARERALVRWPDHPVVFEPRPAWARGAAPFLYFLFYRSPAPFDPVAPHRYLLAPIEPLESDEDVEAFLRATNDSVIKLNHVVHHGGIGHHVQNAHAREAKSLVGRIAAVDGASRIAMGCGGTMAEGWACYATDLMNEAGFLTPRESFSQHHAHVRMAARAIVDVGLHCGDMSFDDAVGFYVDRTNMSPDAARGEVAKNSMFPGAGVIYFLGTRSIRELREELAARDGADFELGRFHDRLLSYGSIPVLRIADEMRQAPPAS